MSEEPAEPREERKPLEVVFENAEAVLEVTEPGTGELRFKVHPSSVVKIGGVRFTAVFLQGLLADPPRGSYSFRREGDLIIAKQDPGT